MAMHKLLLADDSVTIQRVIELTFSGEDIQVIAVNDGEQAIARIPIEHPDIVLADIGMPKRNGYEVAAFVKGHADLAKTPVLLLAGAFERVDEARAEQAGCDGVLVKPFEPRQVVARVRELIAASAARSSMEADLALSREEPDVAAVTPEPTSTPAEFPSAAPEPTAEPQVEPVAKTEVETASAFLDPSLDDYFEKLNAAFDDVRRPPPGSETSDTSPAQGGQQGDSLDGYFDRLSAAFADLAKPLRESEGPPASFDELLSEKMPSPAASHQLESEAPVSRPTVSEIGALDVPAYPPPPVATSSLPTLATPILRPEPIEASVPTPASDQHQAAEDVDGIADVLTALLTEPSHFDEPSDRPTARGVASTASIDREALIEEVTRRVLDRLVPEVTSSLRRLVADELEKIGTR